MTHYQREDAPNAGGLHGRDAEVSAVLAARGDPRVTVVWISGPPGSGRSALLRSAAPGGDGSFVLRGARQERDDPAALFSLLLPRERRMPGVSAVRGHLRAAGIRTLLVDDAHWFTAESWRVLRDAAAAVGTTIVATVLSGRDQREPGDVLVRLPPLRDTSAAELIAEIAPALSPAGAERIVRLAGGNPLALAELARRGEPDADDPPTPLLEAAYATLLDELPSSARTAAQLIAIADWQGDGVSAADIRLSADDLAALTKAGAIRQDGGRIGFTHSAVRRSLMTSVPPSQKRKSARLLSESAVTELDALWFRAAATDGEDRLLGDALEQAAGGVLATRPGTAARLLERAAVLHPAGAARRWTLAAEARTDAQEGFAVPALLARARAARPDPESLARAALVDASRELQLGHPAVARQHLRSSLVSFPAGHPKRSRAISIASEVALWFGRPDWADDLLAVIDGKEPGAALATRVARYLRSGRSSTPVGLAQGDVREQVVAAGVAAVLDLDESAVAHVVDAVTLTAPQALTGHVLRSLSNWHGAAGSRPIAGTDAPWELALQFAARAHSAADRGDDESCRGSAGEAMRLAVLAEFPFAAAHAQWALARMQLQNGEPSAVIALLEDVVRAGSDVHHPVIAALAGPDLLEALARSGEQGRFAEVRAHLPQGFPAESWASVAYGRAAALVGPDPVRDLDEIAKIAAQTGRRLDEARCRLLRGESLRRARRRVDARADLRVALDIFGRLGAAGWAGRAARELDATNEVVRREEQDSPLTPRQLQIAMLVAQGASNQEIAERLGVSRKTVEHHLHNAYGVLGIRSRRELADVVARMEAAASV